VVLVLLAAGTLAVHLASRDIPAFDDSDLRVERIDLPAEQNAFTYFAQATNVMYWPEEWDLMTNYASGAVGNETIQDLLTKNAETFALLERGLQCERSVPPVVNSYTSLVSHAVSWRALGRLLAFKARHERLTGRRAEATTTCCTLLVFADRIQADAGCLIEYLVGTAVFGLAQRQVSDLARDPATPVSELERLATGLAEMGPFVPGLVRSFKAEYRLAADLFDQLAAGRVRLGDMIPTMPGQSPSWLQRRRMPRFFLQPNRAKQECARLYRDRIRCATLPMAEVKPLESEAMTERPNLGWLVKPNMVGRMFQRMLLPATDGVFKKKCCAEADLAAMRLVVACRLYQRQEGRWPETLEALVPAYLPAVPADPFDGKPFRYVPARGIVYSVGKDLKDSGGSMAVPGEDAADATENNRWEAEDAVYALE